MSTVKVYRITGQMVKPNLKTGFRKEVRATKPEDAQEKIYKELGSKHRAKRFQIRIFKIEEVAPEDIENTLIKKITLGKEEADSE